MSLSETEGRWICFPDFESQSVTKGQEEAGDDGDRKFVEILWRGKGNCALAASVHFSLTAVIPNGLQLIGARRMWGWDG